MRCASSLLRFFSLALSAPAILAASPAAQGAIAKDAVPKADLSVLLVANTENARGQSFGAWLRRRFARVEVVSLAEVKPGAVAARASKHDVVLLDWSARDFEMSDGATPLGDRSQWTKPVVFLGRTGMDMAQRWQLEGWFG